MCTPDTALWGLLHDASEAYLVDVPSPLKYLPEFAVYRQYERKLMNVICDVFNLQHDEPEAVNVVDKRMFATEARDLTMTEGRGWISQYEPYEFHIKAWTPEYARAKFISRLHELTMTMRAV
jgi:hypothetical protein